MIIERTKTKRAHYKLFICFILVNHYKLILPFSHILIRELYSFFFNKKLYWTFNIIHFFLFFISCISFFFIFILCIKLSHTLKSASFFPMSMDYIWSYKAQFTTIICYTCVSLPFLLYLGTVWISLLFFELIQNNLCKLISFYVNL
jgi:hypothetical protein